MKREGITAGGNWIIDTIKMVDTYPEEGNLGNIIETCAPANGGCPYNVLLDLAKLETGLPLQGVGAIGYDDAGDFILADCKTYGIDTTLLHKKRDVPTSYTDVFNVKSTGHRTFFHAQGANALLDIDDFDIEKITGRIFLLGYLLLLNKLDAPDDEFGTRAARLLSKISEAGIETAVDIVSEDGDRFSTIVTPALPYVDYFIVNEIEASKIVSIPARDENGDVIEENIKKILEALLECGVRKQVVIHMPDGGYSLRKSDNEYVVRKSVKLPKNFIVGATGAGDAFCAGTLFGIYSGWDTPKTLRFAEAMAVASLRSPAASDGIEPIDKINELITSLE